MFLSLFYFPGCHTKRGDSCRHGLVGGHKERSRVAGLRQVCSHVEALCCSQELSVALRCESVRKRDAAGAPAAGDLLAKLARVIDNVVGPPTVSNMPAKIATSWACTLQGHLPQESCSQNSHVSNTLFLLRKS